MCFLEGELMSDEEVNKQRALRGLPALEETKKDIVFNLEELLKPAILNVEQKEFVEHFGIIEGKIGDKQRAIFGGVLLFDTFEEYAEALHGEDENEIIKLMQSSKIYHEQANNRLKDFSPMTSQISFDISKKIAELTRIFPI